MKPLIIFGTGKISDVVYDCLRRERNVVAFCVDGEYLSNERHYGLPVLPFEDVQKTYNPSDHEIFIALGYQDLNKARADKIEAARSKGYTLASYIDPRASIADSAGLGEHCFIMDGVAVQPRCLVGDDVFIWSNTLVGHHSQVGSHSWLVSMTAVCGSVEIGEYCFLGANSTIVNGISLGDRCFVGANALVAKDLTDESVVIAERDKPQRLSSRQFLRMSVFN